LGVSTLKIKHFSASQLITTILHNYNPVSADCSEAICIPSATSGIIPILT
jgi:hypothetical protein